MAVGVINSLGGKENLPEYNVAGSPKKGSLQKAFLKIAEGIVSSPKKRNSSKSRVNFQK